MVLRTRRMSRARIAAWVAILFALERSKRRRLRDHFRVRRLGRAGFGLSAGLRTGLRFYYSFRRFPVYIQQLAHELASLVQAQRAEARHTVRRVEIPGIF